MPTGAGKSSVAVSIEKGADPEDVVAIINPNNSLIQQYLANYLEHNYLIGKDKYTCHSGGSCGATINSQPEIACEGCPYLSSKFKALAGKPTIFNAHSAYYLKKYNPSFDPTVMIVDEAHLMVPIFREFASNEFRQKYWEFSISEVETEFAFANWAQNKIEELQLEIALADREGEGKEVRRLKRDLGMLTRVWHGFQYNPEQYALTIMNKEYKGSKEPFLIVECTHSPAWATDVIFRAKKLILMSATLFPPDIEELLKDRAYKILDLPSEIPIENRLIQHYPTSFPMNWQTNPTDVVEVIEDVLEKHVGLNTIIHCTYKDNVAYEACFTKFNVKSHTSETKLKVLEEFKKNGGILLASGMSEGIDLKDDLARVNIIPRLLRPDMSAPIQQKRLARPGGQRDYDLTTLKNLIQQCGRTTRGATDKSVVYVLDPRLYSLVKKYENMLPKSFTESILWAARKKGK